MRAFPKYDGYMKYFLYDNNTVFVFWGDVGRYITLRQKRFHYSTWRLLSNGKIEGLLCGYPPLTQKEFKTLVGALYKKIPKTMPTTNLDLCEPSRS